MASTINPATREITVPQGDLSLVAGTLFTHDTEAFRLEMMALLDTEENMWLPDWANRNAPVVVAGVTNAQTMTMKNGFFITYDDGPGAYSVRLEGSNNDMWDIQSGNLTQNLVQVIPTNSAGLIQVATTDGWQTTEREQIRDALGIDGNKTAAASGQLQTALGRLDVAVSTRMAAGASVSLTSAERDAVVQALLGGELPSGESVEDTLDLLRKVHTNRLDAVPGDPGTLTLYDDDGTTPLKIWELRDHQDDGVVGVYGAPAKRGQSA